MTRSTRHRLTARHPLRLAQVADVESTAHRTNDVDDRAAQEIGARGFIRLAWIFSSANMLSSLAMSIEVRKMMPVSSKR